MTINPFGFSVFSRKQYQALTGVPSAPIDLFSVKLQEEYLKGSSYSADLPTSSEKLYEEFTGDFLSFPLQGSTISNHFENMAETLLQQARPGLEDLLGGIDCRVLPVEYDVEPDKVMPDLYTYLRAGWVRYDFDTQQVSTVDHPLELGFAYDTETFVQGSPFALPVIATGVSSKAAYVWLSKQLAEYNIECLLCSHPFYSKFVLLYPQSYLWLSIRDTCNFSYDDAINDLPSVGTGKTILCHNSAYDAVRCKERYLGEPTTPVNFFLDTMSMHTVVAGLNSWQRALWVSSSDKPYPPRWTQLGCPKGLVDAYNFHCVPLGCTPIAKEIKETRNIFVKAIGLHEIRAKLGKLSEYALNDPWYTFQLGRAIYPKYVQACPSKVTQAAHHLIASSNIHVTDDYNEWLERCNTMHSEINNQISSLLLDLADDVYGRWLVDPKEVQSDVFYKHLDWHIVRGSDVPEWYRHKAKITARSAIAPLLLRLRWNGSPVYKTKDRGWCYDDPNGHQQKIPHPDGTGENVGNLLGARMLQYIEDGILKGE
jgi:DNA polymerase gamma 1